jgi:peptidoglycan/xylan/chitin deacetylase (PgdA/CDA1 family)
MGAPVRSWLARLLVSAVAVAAVAAVLSAAFPLWMRLAALAAGLVGVFDQAYRRLPPFDPRGRVRWRLPRRAAKRCAITFDDGPSASTEAVLDILAKEGVPATFFVLGASVERHPAVVRRMQADGHAVGIHGMDHAKLAGAREAAVERQVGGVTDLLARLGVTVAPVYRTPHGFKSRAVFSVAKRRGLTLWAWSRGVWDTDRPDPRVLVRRATRFARSGMVLLLHDGRGDEAEPDVAPMVAALPAILKELKRRRFRFVRLADV